MENGYKEEIEKYLKDTDDINFEIRRLNRENRNLTAGNNEKIEKLQLEMESVEFKMKDAFTKTGDDKVQTKMGFTTWKVLNKRLVFRDPAISELETNYPETANKYIKTTKTLIKDSLKKDLMLGTIVLSKNSMGEETPDKKFVYKYTGGNK